MSRAKLRVDCNCWWQTEKAIQEHISIMCWNIWKGSQFPCHSSLWYNKIFEHVQENFKANLSKWSVLMDVGNYLNLLWKHKKYEKLNCDWDTGGVIGDISSSSSWAPHHMTSDNKSILDWREALCFWSRVLSCYAYMCCCITCSRQKLCQKCHKLANQCSITMVPCAYSVNFHLDFYRNLVQYPINILKYVNSLWFQVTFCRFLCNLLPLFST